MSPVGHIFPLGCNTADTQVRGSTTDTRKAGAGAQTESPGLTAGGGQECLLQNKGPGITSELALGDDFMCEQLGALFIGQLRVLTSSSLWWD
ncbi:hypothetical protein KIN20_014646 [Parelaphostrongylus tenuis]|uniref:Uncharacterized protein n=1 Tax=Parelaphostrongylus tenuis TaxID=148309 RepID=A0AAD5QLT9_PARTN|nr:hypothetical protein KIN20_014646 [Parelaphostrongylus tenuis]